MQVVSCLLNPTCPSPLIAMLSVGEILITNLDALYASGGMPLALSADATLDLSGAHPTLTVASGTALFFFFFFFFF